MRRSLDDVLTETVRLAAACTPASVALLLEWVPARAAFTIRASHGWPVRPEEDAFAVPPSRHALEAMSGRQGGLIRRDLAGRADEPRLLAAHALHAGAAVAIADGVGPFGVLAVYSEDATAFAEETLRTLDALASLAAAAVEGTRQAADLDGGRDELVRLASLVEGSADAIVSATLEGTILAWNPGAERLYGYPAHEILGQDVSVLIPAEREADRRLMLERVRAGARIPAFDATHRRKDGSPVTVSLSLSPVKDRDGRVVAVAGIAHDVTETRRLESELRQLAKMEAVGRLAGGLAHDFNNMLTVIDGYSQLVLMKLPADSPVRGLIEEIHKAGERAADLTRQLMVFSRKTMVDPRVLNLTDVVRSNVEMLARALGDDISMITELEPALANVMADHSQLEQVLVNLVLNARDAMPAGGRVTLSTANVQFDTLPGGIAKRSARRAVRRARGRRHRCRHGRRHPRPSLRAVLHDQGQGPWHRPRIGDAAALRDAKRGVRNRRLRAGTGQPVPNLPADGAAAARAGRRGRCRGFALRLGIGPGRRGRPVGATVHPIGLAGGRVSGALRRRRQ